LSQFDLDTRPLDEQGRAHNIASRRSYNRKFPELAPLTESICCPKGALVEVDGGTHSNKMDQAFSYYDHIYSAIPKSERLDSILEIGSGYGRLARIMRELDPSRRYILVDLPESLIFAYAFLAVSFPESKRLFVSSHSEAAQASRGHYDFVFCPIQFVDRLDCGQIDLLVNTYSLAEMPQASVDYLMRIVHTTLRPRFLYSLNMMFSDKDINFDTGGHHGEANRISLNLAPEWSIRGFKLFPAVHSGQYRWTAAAVFERMPDMTPSAATTRVLSDASSLELGADARLGNLFLASLWSSDRAITQQFMSELKTYCDGQGFGPDVGYDFDKIGEVRFLRERVAH
jgi:SAM-dependent methyltransferase